MKKFLTTILFLALATITAIAIIPSQEVISIEGRVEDASTGKPLSFASIHLLNTNISNVTNADGNFLLKIPRSIKADTVMVSYLGYRSARVAVNDFFSKKFLISLEPSIVFIGPVTIRPQDALSILKMAYARVPENYSATTKQMTAFYREMIQKRNRYVSINEAVLDVTKAPYKGYKSDQIGIYKARGNYDINRLDTLLIKFQGGPNSALDLDIVKDPFLGIQLIMLDKIYDFKFGNPVTLADRFFYVIEFDQKENTADVYFRGRVYIDAETFAIGRAQFAMNVEGNKEANSYFIKKKPAKLNMDVLSANYLVNYKIIDSLWFFDYSRTEVKFNSKWKGKWFSNEYTISSEIAVTDISDTERKIEKQNRIRSKDIISNKVKDFTDQDFWEDYNIIEPDASIDKVISRIIKQLRKRQ